MIRYPPLFIVKLILSKIILPLLHPVDPARDHDVSKALERPIHFDDFGNKHPYYLNQIPKDSVANFIIVLLHGFCKFFSIRKLLRFADDHRFFPDLHCGNTSRIGLTLL